MNSMQGQTVFNAAEVETLKKACDKFGFTHQCAKAVEEYCELITGVYMHGGKGTAICDIPCNPDPSISTEVADCLIMMGQMSIFEGQGLRIPEIINNLSDHCLDYLSNYTKQYPQEVRGQLAFKLERLEKLLNE